MRAKVIKINPQDLKSIHEMLFRNGKVKVGGLGTLEIIKCKKRTFKHNFYDGKLVTIPSFYKPKFSPELSFKKRVRSYRPRKLQAK